MVRVLFADDHAVVRDGLRRILAQDHRLQVVGEASDFFEAITKAHNTGPDVLILDLHMPLGPGLITSNLNAQLNSCGAKVLLISFANDDDAKSLATSIGATELLDKTRLGTDLIPAVIRVVSEGNHLPSSVNAKPGDRSQL